jgi:hypothetical protein
MKRANNVIKGSNAEQLSTGLQTAPKKQANDTANFLL